MNKIYNTVRSTLCVSPDVIYNGKIIVMPGTSALIGGYYPVCTYANAVVKDDNVYVNGESEDLRIVNALLDDISKLAVSGELVVVVLDPYGSLCKMLRYIVTRDNVTVQYPKIEWVEITE